MKNQLCAKGCLPGFSKIKNDALRKTVPGNPPPNQNAFPGTDYHHPLAFPPMLTLHTWASYLKKLATAD